VAAAEYTDPLSKVITLWKYQDQRYLSDVLAELLRDWVASHAPAWWEKIEAIVPVPHHPKALRARGFSPPEELSRRLSASFALPYMPRVVYKIRHTLPQACLDAATRRMNVHASMKVFDPALVEGRVLLAVDDVMTTGATLSECARALIEAGASKVYCLALARQSH
jgi:ComF family protein